MFKITVTLAIISILEPLQLSRCKSIPQIEDSLFHKTNNIPQNVINTLFIPFEIKKHFLESNKMQFLLTMHNGFKDVADYNFKIYNNIVKSINASDTMNFTALFNLTEIIEEISNDDHLKFMNNAKLNNLKNYVIKNDSLEDINATSILNPKFYKEFLSRMSHVDTESVKLSSVKLKYKTGFKERKRSRRKKTYNLKFWSE